VIHDLRLFGRYVSGLRAFLREPMTHEECRRYVEARIDERDESFLSVLERAALRESRSPYRRLFEHAGIEAGDVGKLVRGEGIDATLARLYDAGVYVTLDEFKGQRPIRRGDLEFPVAAEDFDNPLLAAHYEGRSGGSRGAPRPIRINFDHLAHVSAYHAVYLSAFKLEKRPAGAWHPLPPGLAGMGALLVNGKLGRRVERWFSQTWFEPTRAGLRAALLTGAAFAASRGTETPFPLPKSAPPEEALRVSHWLEAKRREGLAAVLQTTPSSAVRVCAAAAEHGLDIGGTVFEVGGEPYTAGRAELVEAAGCRGVSHYYMSEIGQAGIACAAPVAFDDVHLTLDTLALIERGDRDGAGSPGRIHLSSLRPTSPKVMVNVEIGDGGILEDRACGCFLSELGYSRHLHTIRSWEKLTSEGMGLVAGELGTLVEQVLPGRFGGDATDYQLVEDRGEGSPRILVVVSPRIGDLEETEVVDVVLRSLEASGGAKALAGRVWKAAGTLQVVRREPYATAGSKVLPLHVIHRG
jgi:hypothetical protein